MPQVFEFRPPAIPSSGVYYFETPRGMEYEVRFGRKQNDILAVNIVFGVLNDEFGGEEYVLTNEGEFYSVMATIEAIIHDFFSKNSNIHSFEFAGEPSRENHPKDKPTKRTKVYMRYARKIFPEPDWKITQEGNKVYIQKRN